MGKWTQELKSGKHKQAHRVLKNEDSWCCIGLREEIVEGIEFYKDDGFWFDPDGLYAMASQDRLDKWGIGYELEEEEKEKARKIIEKLTKSSDKIGWAKVLLRNEDLQPSQLLAGMNDNGFTFKQIGTLIERMGWDNS